MPSMSRSQTLTNSASLLSARRPHAPRSHPMPKKNRPLHRQRGISLLESLVAIIVMALGILGVLGLQLRTLADTQNSVNRAQAIRFIEDLSERMKINPNALGNLGSYVSGWQSPASASLPNCATAACTASDLALYDITQWKDAVISALGNGDKTIADANIFLVSDEAADDRRQLGVMISWRENERSNDANYTSLFVPDDTGTTAGVSCPPGRSCHLQYVQLTSRCEPDFPGDPDAPRVHCPGV